MKHIREGGGGYFLKTPILLRFLTYLANLVPLILILPCDDRETDRQMAELFDEANWSFDEFFDL